MATGETADRLWALGDGAPVAVRSVLAAGITRAQLRAALAAGRVRRVGHGVVAPVADGKGGDPTFITTRERVASLMARRPGLIISHGTAAEMLELPTLRGTSGLLHATAPYSARRSGLIIHQAEIEGDDVVDVDGVPVTSVLRTAVDIARSVPLPEALITLDAALRIRALQLARSPDGVFGGSGSGVAVPDHEAVEDSAAQQGARRELAEHVRRAWRRTGADRLRAAARATSPLAESPAESWSRGHLLLAGITPRGLQVRVRDADGVERRLDMLLAEGLAGEVDGLVKYDVDGLSTLRGEKVRDLALERVGVRTVRWTGREAFANPALIVRLARRAMSGGA